MNKTKSTGISKIPNILLLAFDSKAFIERKEFYTMYGYNKVGDNTFPKLVPLLTGHYVEDILNNTFKEKLDYFSLIWKVS